MDLYIKITSGARAGDMFKLQPAITLGRSKADINLKDSKASGIHAKIVNENGALFYLDMNSTNGSLVAGSEIKKIKLIPGLVITIGQTNLEILTEFDIKKTNKVNLSEWRETLFHLVNDLKVNQTAAAIVPFKKCITIKVKSGAQAGKGWILGYGPRTMGPASSDLCLLDNTLEDLCLRISQKKDAVVIDSIGKSFFMVNGQKKNTETLKTQLDIQIGNSLIEIGFLE